MVLVSNTAQILSASNRVEKFRSHTKKGRHWQGKGKACPKKYRQAASDQPEERFGQEEREGRDQDAAGAESGDLVQSL